MTEHRWDQRLIAASLSSRSKLWQRAEILHVGLAAMYSVLVVDSWMSDRIHGSTPCQTGLDRPSCLPGEHPSTIPLCASCPLEAESVSLGDVADSKCLEARQASEVPQHCACPPLVRACSFLLDWQVESFSMNRSRRLEPVPLHGHLSEVHGMPQEPR